MSERTNLVEESSETGSESSPDDNGTIEQTPHEEGTILLPHASVNLVPFIGQRFVSQEAAYEFYCAFAKQSGFSIRRHRTRGRDGVGRGITRRDFTCHRGGYPQLKPTDDLRMQRNRKSLRCGCQAYMRIVKRADLVVSEWRVTAFKNLHNHELKPSEVQLLPADCPMTADDKSLICIYAKAGMSVRQMMRLMEMERGVKIGCLPFSDIYVRNLLQSFSNVERESDPIDLLGMCKEKKDGDHEFKYDYKIDFNNRLEYIAWSYGSSIRLYEDFGDVVVFDTTRRLDAFDMILGILIGVDNRGMYCLFGCLLLRDENMESFSWGLRTFLGFMNGKVPGTILTDQNTWLKEAVTTEMPGTKQAISIWHIMSKFSDWFPFILGSQYNNWKAEFHRLYNMHAVEEFEVGWREMVDIYGLQGNKHIANLYALRTYWALPFLRSYFFAGMSKAFQADSINAYVQQFLTSQSVVVDNFIEQVASVLEARDRSGPKTKPHQAPKPCLKTGSPIESHASTVLTPYAFSNLQDELLYAPQYSTMLVDGSYFIVRHHTEATGGCKVMWAPQDELITCSCRHFEFSGILCRHVLRILSANNCFRIPDRYLPQRWRESKRTATSSSGKALLLQSMMSSLIAESVENEDRLDFVCDHVAFVLARVREFPFTVAYKDSPAGSLVLPDVEDSDSIEQSFSGNPIAFTKLEDRRSRDEIDMFRKRRRFGLETSNCAMVGDDDLSGNGVGFLQDC
ncbi:hypothetical protein CASFOL_029537 [Castilleja foliolosa]|uniref:Protein FAR1-RELATED SEQUENCE n=1 Tax=Castilleja foliolosa TaxID=1961234 RepID=A0ABD3C873_9LAMI